MMGFSCEEVTDKLNQEDDRQNKDQGDNDDIVLVTLVTDRDRQIPKAAAPNCTCHSG